MRPGTTLAGSLETLSLAELIGFISAKAQTGVLSFAGGVDAKLVLVQGGVALGLSGNGPTPQEAIIGAGLVEEETWQQAESAARSTGAMTAALTELGATEAGLATVLRRHTVDVIVEVLLAPRATFELLGGETHQLGDRFTFDADESLAAATELASAWRSVESKTPGATATLVPARHLTTDSVTLTAQQWSLLAVLDGHRTVEDLVPVLGQCSIRLRTDLGRLLETGLVVEV